MDEFSEELRVMITNGKLFAFLKINNNPRILHFLSLFFNFPLQTLFSNLFHSTVDMNAFNRGADIRILSQDTITVSHSNIDREYVVLYTAAAGISFFVLYTNRGQIIIYSTRTT